MLEYVSIIKNNPYWLGFVDVKSPKDWETIINHKLSEYEENAYIDSTIKTENIIVILELKPQNKIFNHSEYVMRKRKEFENYYTHILDEIANSEFYDLYLE